MLKLMNARRMDPTQAWKGFSSSFSVWDPVFGVKESAEQKAKLQASGTEEKFKLRHKIQHPKRRERQGKLEASFQMRNLKYVVSFASFPKNLITAHQKIVWKGNRRKEICGLTA